MPQDKERHENMKFEEEINHMFCLNQFDCIRFKGNQNMTVRKLSKGYLGTISLKENSTFL
jgi:hypothetical protein